MTKDSGGIIPKMKVVEKQGKEDVEVEANMAMDVQEINGDLIIPFVGDKYAKKWLGINEEEANPEKT